MNLCAFTAMHKMNFRYVCIYLIHSQYKMSREFEFIDELRMIPAILVEQVQC